MGLINQKGAVVIKTPRFLLIYKQTYNKIVLVYEGDHSWLFIHTETAM